MEQHDINRIALVAFVFGILALGTATGTIQNLLGLTCTNCTLDNPTFINFTFPNGTDGTTNHDELNRLNWSESGHILDSDLLFASEANAIQSQFGHSRITLSDTVDGVAMDFNVGNGVSSYMQFTPDYYTISAASDATQLYADSLGLSINALDLSINGNTGQTVDVPYLEDAVTSKTMHYTNGILTSIDGQVGVNGTVNYDLINLSLGEKVNKSGDTMTGDLTLSNGAYIYSEGTSAFVAEATDKTLVTLYDTENDLVSTQINVNGVSNMVTPFPTYTALGANLSLSGYNLNDCGNCQISTMDINNSHVGNTVYRNNLNVPIYVAVILYDTVGRNWRAFVGAPSNPTSIVSVDTTAGTANGGLNFIVLPGYYYKVNNTAGGGGVITNWIEWS